MLSVFGGKITTYRKLAEQALADLAPYFPEMKAAWTRDTPLPGGELPGGTRIAAFAELCSRYPGIPAELLRALMHRHGALATTVLDNARGPADLGEDFGAELTAREVDYFVVNEWARSATDVLWRRSKCGLSMSGAQRERVEAYVASRKV
jgi:glycerol-3-phosphate dehydrogenase